MKSLYRLCQCSRYFGSVTRYSFGHSILADYNLSLVAWGMRDSRDYFCELETPSIYHNSNSYACLCRSQRSTSRSNRTVGRECQGEVPGQVLNGLWRVRNQVGP